MKFGFLVRIVISILLMYYIVHDVNFGEILSSIEGAKFSILLLAFLLHFIGLFLSSVRWKVLLTAQGVQSKLLFLFQSYLVASFINHFLPSTIGGDSVRTFDSWKLGENKEKAFAVVILDRFLGLLTLLIFAIISMLFSNDITDVIPWIHIWTAVFSIGALLLIWFMMSPPLDFFSHLKKTKKGIVGKVAGFIHKIDVAFSQFADKKSSLLTALFLSFLLQFNVVLYYYAISVALGLNVQLIDFFLVVPLTIFVTMIPISLNGIGLRENALFLFLAPFGVLQSQAIAFAWLEYGMLLILGLVGGVIYIFRK